MKKRAKEKFTVWDIQDHLKTEKERRMFLKAVVAEYADDPAFISQCLGEVARARGMAKVAKDTGLSRESLYKALTAGANPRFATIMKVANSFGVQLRVT